MVNNKAKIQENQETVIMAVRHDAEALIAKAIDKKVPVETMERLLKMRSELRAEWAKAEFAKAMAAFQAECPIIKKTKGVRTDTGEIAYKYAPLESIVEQVKDTLCNHGFSYCVDQPEAKQGYIKVALTVKHTSGHSEVTSVELPLGNKTRIMSQTQVEAAALTFAKRYAFCNAFGILTGDDDTDAKPTSGDSASTSNNHGTSQSMHRIGRVTYGQANTIRRLLKQKGYTESDLLKTYPVGNIAYLASTQAEQIIANLKELPDGEAEDAGDHIVNDAARNVS
jgi:ERF superfamily